MAGREAVSVKKHTQPRGGSISGRQNKKPIATMQVQPQSGRHPSCAAHLGRLLLLLRLLLVAKTVVKRQLVLLLGLGLLGALPLLFLQHRTGWEALVNVVSHQASCNSGPAAGSMPGCAARRSGTATWQPCYLCMLSHRCLPSCAPLRAQWAPSAPASPASRTRSASSSASCRRRFSSSFSRSSMVCRFSTNCSRVTRPTVSFLKAASMACGGRGRAGAGVAGAEDRPQHRV